MEGHSGMAADTKREDSAQIVTTLTTEHFTLQTARSATISDTNGRTSLYLNSVSSAIVALALIAQVSELGDAFSLFALILLPSLFFLGLVSHTRVLQSAIEDMQYARAINRIRHYYLEAAPHLAPYFLLSAHDDGPGTGRNMGITASPAQFLVTAAGTVAIINSIIGGVGAGLALHRFASPPLLTSTGMGVAVALVSAALHFRFERDQWRRFEERTPSLFPTPPGDTTR